MNQNFLRIIQASPEDQRGLFLTAANRLGTTLQNIEKDFGFAGYWILFLMKDNQKSLAFFSKAAHRYLKATRLSPDFLKTWILLFFDKTLAWKQILMR